jgi:hypothetical protein
MLWAFVVAFLALGYLGSRPAEGAYVLAAQILTAVYFGYFVALPIVGVLEKPLPLPISINEPVLAAHRTPQPMASQSVTRNQQTARE